MGIAPTYDHSLLPSLKFGVTEFFDKGKLIFQAVGTLLASIFTGDFTFNMLNGPVGIYHNVDTVVKSGIYNLISYTALLSVNLGIMNLLPIPALDGGRFYSLFMKLSLENQLIKSRNNDYCSRGYFCLACYDSSNME